MALMTLQRYFLLQFIRFFGILTTGLALFFSAVHMIDKIDEIMPYHPSPADIGSYFLFILPKYFLYLLPMSTLLCIILTFSIAARRKEVIAYKASGGNIRELLAPFLVTGLLISLADIALSEYAVPRTNESAHDLLYRLREEKKRPHLKQGDIWLKGRQGIIHAETYIPSENTLKNVELFTIAGSRPSSFLIADEAVWEEGTWIFRNARQYDFFNHRVADLENVGIPGFADPEIFASGILTPEEMGIVDLVHYKRRLAASGYRNKKLDVDILSRMFYPFTCLFMLMLGLSISLRKEVGSGIIGVTIGIIISLAYWFIYSFLLSLGFTGVLPPVLSAGTAPLMFGIAGAVMMRKIPG